jgi:protein O-GlcNAc transferase
VQNRVRFIPWQSLDDYYRLISVADVVLDALHFSAGSSSYDMFSLNQPIVTLPGELNVGRYTQACYRRMGFTDLIATSPNEYVQKAIRVASDADYRQHVRQTLAERTPILFEDFEAVREHERFFWEAYESLRRNE